ncbi:peroxiredoxin family protein [Aquabacterium sp.]|uniref:peroxiredoxin family protein n=1 Tax=Aquabacterium sp. TaxID=1872578 RepID=UPI0035AF4BEC
MKFSRRHLALFGLALPVFLSGCFSDSGSAMPVSSYALLDGSTHSTSELKGKVTIINFWATSCSTCVKEMPQMVSTFQKFQGQGLQTVAVAMSYDNPQYVAQFAATRQLPFTVAYDKTGEMANAFGPVQMTPTTFVVNRKGEIVKRYVGEPDFSALHDLLGKLLAESA